MQTDQYDAQTAAEQDAQTDTNKIIWILAGLFGNIIGLIIAYIYQPDPSASRLFEKSEEYKLFYRDAYRAKCRSLQLTYALIGLAIPILGVILILGGVLVFFGVTVNMMR